MIDAAALRRALDAVAPADRRPKAEIGVRLHTDVLTVVVLNPDLRLEFDVPCPGRRKADTTVVPLARLRRAAEELTGALTLAIDEDGLTVSSERSTYTVGATGAKWTDGTLTDEVIARLTGDQISDMARIRFAASQDTMRPTLTCISVEDGVAAATDSYRLCFVELDPPAKANVVIPGAAFDHLPDGDVEIRKGGPEHIGWQAGPLTVLVKLPTQPFPNWRSLVPETHDGTLTINRSEVLAALRRLERFDEDASAATSLGRLGKDKLELKTRTATEYVAATFTGKWPMPSFNAGFLADGIEACSDEDVTILLRDALKPAVIEDDDFTYLLMPVRCG